MERVSEARQDQAGWLTALLSYCWETILPRRRGLILTPYKNMGGVEVLVKYAAWSQGQTGPWYLKEAVPGAPRDTSISRNAFYAMAW